MTPYTFFMRVYFIHTFPRAHMDSWALLLQRYLVEADETNLFPTLNYNVLDTRYVQIWENGLSKEVQFNLSSFKSYFGLATTTPDDKVVATWIETTIKRYLTKVDSNVRESNVVFGTIDELKAPQHSSKYKVFRESVARSMTSEPLPSTLKYGNLKFIVAKPAKSSVVDVDFVNMELCFGRGLFTNSTVSQELWSSTSAKPRDASLQLSTDMLRFVDTFMTSVNGKFTYRTATCLPGSSLENVSLVKPRPTSCNAGYTSLVQWFQTTNEIPDKDNLFYANKQALPSLCCKNTSKWRLVSITDQNQGTVKRVKVCCGGTGSACQPNTDLVMNNFAERHQFKTNAYCNLVLNDLLGRSDDTWKGPWLCQQNDKLTSNKFEFVKNGTDGSIEVQLGVKKTTTTTTTPPPANSTTTTTTNPPANSTTTTTTNPPANSTTTTTTTNSTAPTLAWLDAKLSSVDSSFTALRASPQVGSFSGCETQTTMTAIDTAMLTGELAQRKLLCSNSTGKKVVVATGYICNDAPATSIVDNDGKTAITALLPKAQNTAIALYGVPFIHGPCKRSFVNAAKDLCSDSNAELLMETSAKWASLPLLCCPPDYDISRTGTIPTCTGTDALVSKWKLPFEDKFSKATTKSLDVSAYTNKFPGFALMQKNSTLYAGFTSQQKCTAAISNLLTPSQAYTDYTNAPEKILDLNLTNFNSFSSLVTCTQPDTAAGVWIPKFSLTESNALTEVLSKLVTLVDGKGSSPTARKIATPSPATTTTTPSSPTIIGSSSSSSGNNATTEEEVDDEEMTTSNQALMVFGIVFAIIVTICILVIVGKYAWDRKRKQPPQ